MAMGTRTVSLVTLTKSVRTSNGIRIEAYLGAYHFLFESANFTFGAACQLRELL